MSTGRVRAELRPSSFGKGDKGLVIGMTKAEIEAAAALTKKPKDSLGFLR